MDDIKPLSSNSSDRRTPLIMVSPSERQKKLKSMKTEEFKLREKVAQLELELLKYKNSSKKYSEEEVAMMLNAVSKFEKEKFLKESLQNKTNSKSTKKENKTRETLCT